MTKPTPGPLVVGPRSTTYRFEPIGATIQPRKEVIRRWMCPYGNHGGDALYVRRYPDLDEPALFVDCGYCQITWELPYTPEDPEPQPADGPEYHEDHRAWEARR